MYTMNDAQALLQKSQQIILSDKDKAWVMAVLHSRQAYSFMFLNIRDSYLKDTLSRRMPNIIFSWLKISAEKQFKLLECVSLFYQLSMKCLTFLNVFFIQNHLANNSFKSISPAYYYYLETLCCKFQFEYLLLKTAISTFIMIPQFVAVI